MPRAALRALLAAWLERLKGKSSVTDVAERTGVKKQTLYDILHEKSDTKDVIVQRIAKAFRVDPPTVILAPSGSFADWLETLPGDERLAKSVALHWHDLIVEHKLPWDDMIALLHAEAT